jgi:hypothetical protein
LCRVSEDYLEGIIISSEQDLAESKRRLYNQVRQLRTDLSA